MKFTPEVVAALETLKNAAENDFERHRIDVLEKDLTDPPKVEVIDETHQKFFGFNFRLTKGGHYFYNMGLQQAVWFYHNGEIPPKHEIHHIDEDKANNNIENLQLLTGSEHRKLHNLLGVPVATPKKREFVCKNCGQKFIAFDVGRNLFCSSRCHYQYHKVIKKCVECGKEFLTNKYGKARFCSVKCKHVARSRACSEVRVCPACKKEFVTPHSDRRTFCSRKCADSFKSQSHTEERTCPVCGRKFTSTLSKSKVCCSRSCASRFRIARGMSSLFPQD